MSKSILRPLFRSLLLALFPCLIPMTASAQSTPSAATPRPLQPAPLPALLEDAGSELLAVIRVRNPAQTLQRLAHWVPQVNTRMTSELLIQQFEAFGLSPDFLRPGLSAYFCVWRPSSPDARPGWTLRVPVTADSPLWAGVMLMNRPWTGMNDDLFVADSDATLEARVTNGGEALQRMGGRSGPSDFQVYFNAPAFIDTYGDRARVQIAAMRALATSVGVQNPSRRLRRQQRMLGLPLESMLSLAGQIKGLAFSVNLDPEVAEYSLTVEPLPETVLAVAYDREPKAMPDIAKMLGSGHTLLAQISLSEVRDVLDVIDSLKHGPDIEGKSRAWQSLRDALDATEDAAPHDYAAAFDFSAEHPFRAFVVARADDPAKLAQTIQGSPQLLAMHTVGEKIANAGTLALTTSTRLVDGEPVTRIQMNFREPVEYSFAESKRFKAMWGAGQTMAEAGTLGPDLAVLSVGVAADQAFGQDAGGRALQARRWFPAGAFAYVDFDWVAFEQARRRMEEKKVPDVMAPALSAAAYHQNGIGVYRVKFPFAMASAMREIGEEDRNARRAQREAERKAGGQPQPSPASTSSP